MILAKIIKISKIELFAQVQKDALAVRKGGGYQVAGAAVAQLELLLEGRGGLGEIADGEVGLGLCQLGQ